MKILLAQHGDAVDEDVDPDRPLSEKGRREVERVAAFMRGSELRVSRTVHSGKTRARQTAEILAGALQCERGAEAVSTLSPNDPVDQWVARAAGWREDTLLVGHLPFMGRLVSHLAAGDESAAIVEFRPGTVVCMQRNGGSAWQLCWMIRPEILAD